MPPEQRLAGQERHEYGEWLARLQVGDWVTMEDENEPQKARWSVVIRRISPIRIYTKLSSFDRATGYHLAGPWGDSVRLVKPNLPDAPESKGIDSVRHAAVLPSFTEKQ